METKQVEELLGRSLTLTESMVFEMFKNNKEYYFEKDSNGNLKAVRNE